MAFAIKLYESQFKPQYEDEVMMMFSHMAHSAQPKQQEPLILYANDLPGQESTHVKLGLVTSAAAAQDASETSVPGAGGADPVDAEGPPLVQQQQPQAVGFGLGQPTITKDQRYLAFRGGSLEQIAKNLAAQLGTLGTELRHEVVAAEFVGKSGNTIMSPYYQRDARTGRLSVMRLPNGTMPMDRIPTILVRTLPSESLVQKEKKVWQVGVSVQYLSQRFGMIIAEGDEERIMKSVSSRKLHDNEKRLMLKRIATPPIERLQMQTISIEEFERQGMHNLFAAVDCFADPVASAIRGVLECDSFRLTSVKPNGEKATIPSSFDRNNASASLMLWVTPPSFQLTCAVGGSGAPTESVVINMGRFMQLLEVNRNTNDSQLVFINTGRATSTARLQMAAALGTGSSAAPGRFAGTDEDDADASNGLFLDYMQTLGMVVDVDPDLLSARMRLQSLGIDTPQVEEDLLMHAGVENEYSVPFTYPPFRDHVYKWLFESRVSRTLKRLGSAAPGLQTRDLRLAILRTDVRYPADDIKMEVDEARIILTEMRDGSFRRIRTASTVFLRPTAPGTPAAPRPANPALEALRQRARDLVENANHLRYRPPAVEEAQQFVFREESEGPDSFASPPARPVPDARVAAAEDESERSHRSEDSMEIDE